MKVNEQPLVSVLMTSYNREDYIAEAIESVLASTYPHFELIIVDDCSTDKTVSIIKDFLNKDDRISLYVNEKNLQQFPNRNKAASYAKGKYIKYLDSDDRIYDWGLAYCVELMEKYPDAGMGIFQAQNKVDEEYLLPEEAVNKHFFRSSFLNIGPSGIILRRDAFENAGRYNPNYGVPSDMYFNIKLAYLFPVVMLKKEFFFYREHEGQEIKNHDSYLFYNYPYIRDLLLLPELPVSEEGKTTILAGARKRLVKACLSSIKHSRKLAPALKAYKLSGLKFNDVLKTMFS
jgi:glycosyltransferase involved in cell wall biosynthesis